ncbi:MAG TPA: sugar-binding protein [Capsulimonadaceae bacterium]|jgi:hypothetical protein
MNSPFRLAALTTLALGFVIAGFAPLFSASAATFTDGGIVSSPGGQISVGQGGAIAIMTATGDSYALTIPTIVRGGRTHWTAGDLIGRKVTVDAAKKETVFTATIEDAVLTEPIPIRYSIALTPEGKARITLAYESKEPITKLLSLCGIFFYTHRAEMIGTQVTVNSVSVPITAGPPLDHAVMLTTAKEPRDILFASDDPYRTLSVHIVQGTDVAVRDENVKSWQTMGIRIVPVDNQIVMDIELPSKAKALSPETYAGIDFYAAEHIHMPMYSQSRNLIQNPSFEQGFQYWNFGNLGSEKGYRFPDNYLIETATVNSGRKCVKIIGEKGERPALLSSFAIPTEAGKEYTISFFAKADKPNIGLTTCIFPSSFTNGLAWKGITIGTEWKRYNYTFKAPAGAVSMQFGLNGMVDDCAAYLDDVQLEKGPMTDFTRKPIEMVFVTDKRDNLFKPGETVHGRVEFSTLPNASGTASVTMRDAMGTVITQRDVPYKADATGVATSPLPWVEKAARGIYTLEITTKLADGGTAREYGRLAIAPPADPAVKHHTLFACGGIYDRGGSWERTLAHHEYFGIGSAMNFDPKPHSLHALMTKHHVVNVTSIFDSGDHFGNINLKDGWSGNEADLPIIEAAAYAKAKEYPEITYWKLVNEPGGRLTADQTVMKQWIRALTAAYKGIKRANPTAHVLSIDPANMQPNGGTAMVDNFLTCGGAEICDIVAIHPYRTRPEEPDMDADLATFLAMLKRHNFNGEVWFTEGGGHLAMHNPSFALNVHQALSAEDNGGSWRIGGFTYDIGDGERYAAAYAIRAWLVGLKYGDRVKHQVDWYYFTGTVDYDQIPETRGVALNALSTTLGDADFVRDISLSQDARSYLFRDAKKRPVVAIWTHDLKHETAILPPSVLHLGALAKSVQIVNMMGTPITPDKNGDLPVTPFPMYITGEPGSDAKLAAAIEDGFESTSTGSVVGYAQVKDASHVGYELRNTTRKAITGKLTVSSPGKPAVSSTIEALPNKTTEVLAPFATPTTGLVSQDATITWTADGGKAPLTFPAHIDALRCPSVTAPLALDGNLASWKAAGANVFAVPQHAMSYKAYPVNPKYPDTIPWGGASDLSATLAVAYAPGTLYLGFDITDDVFAPAASADKAWMGDGIQIYFDAWSTGHSQLKIGFDDDDQELDVWPKGDAVQVYRSVAPATQVAFTKRGVVGAIKSKLTKRAGGYIVQLAIPEAELAPLSLKAGGVFNLSFIINDNDGEFRKRGLTLTPEGTEPYMHPELYPSVVLGP